MKAKKLLFILFSAFALTSCDLGNSPSLSAESSASSSVSETGSSSSAESSSVSESKGEESSSKHTHTFSEGWKNDATYHWHPSTCGHDEIVAGKEEHEFSKTVTPPTYEEDGYTTFSCACGYSYTGEATSKLEHRFSSDYEHDETSHWHKCIDEGFESLRSGESKHDFEPVTTSPSCEEEGYTTYTCKGCSYSYISDKTMELGHSYQEEWKYDETSHWHEASCGHEVKGKEGEHDYEDRVVKATFASGGYTLHVCKTCGYSYRDNDTSPLDHSYSKEWKHDKTSHWRECTDEGYEELVVEKGDHTFSDWVEGATSEDDKGKKTRKCTTCGYEDEKTIDYSVSKERWIEAFKTARNFMGKTSGNTSEGNYEYVIKANYGIIWSSFTRQTGSSIETRYGITEIIEGQDYKYTYSDYEYDSTFDFWAITSEYSDSYEYESLKKMGFESYIDYFYDREMLGKFANIYDKFTFDSTKNAYYCESFSIAVPGGGLTVTNGVIKFVDNELVEIRYEQKQPGYEMHTFFTDFGSTEIDESFRDKIHKHTYDETDWESNEYGHWHVANCEDKDQLPEWNSRFDFDNHAFVDGVCSTCGYECPHSYVDDRDEGFYCYMCPYEHTHDDVSDEPYVVYEEDSYLHGKKCPSCGRFVKSTLAWHSYEDCVCTFCGQEKHNYKYGRYSFDSQYHWNEFTCSHKDADNSTKEAHDFSSFGDVCSVCHYFNNDAATHIGEQVDEDTWKKSIEAIDRNNLTVLEAEYGGVSRIKFDGKYQELVKLRNHWNGKAKRTLYAAEGERRYRYYELEDGSYERREMLDWETTPSGSISGMDDINKLLEIPFAEFSYDDVSGAYRLNENSDYKEDVGYSSNATVKFVDGSLSVVSLSYDVSGDLIAFYDFGKTKIKDVGECKTFTPTSACESGEHDFYYHYFVFECGEEKKTYSDVYEQHSYKPNENNEIVCSKCGHHCEHRVDFYTYKCDYCDYYHLHELDEEGVCRVCGESDATRIAADDLFVTNFFYLGLESFTSKGTSYYRDYDEDGGSSTETAYVTLEKLKIERNGSIRYEIKVNEYTCANSLFQVDENGEMILDNRWEGPGTLDFYLDEYNYAFRKYLEDRISSEPVFAKDSDNENVYVYHDPLDYENSDFIDEMITIEFLPTGGIKSIKIVREYFSFEEVDGVVTKKRDLKSIIEITAINETSFELPDSITLD